MAWDINTARDRAVTDAVDRIDAALFDQDSALGEVSDAVLVELGRYVDNQVGRVERVQRRRSGAGLSRAGRRRRTAQPDDDGGGLFDVAAP